MNDIKQVLMVFAHKQTRNLNNAAVRRDLFTFSDRFWKQFYILRVQVITYNRLKEAKKIMRTNQSPNTVSLANQARNQHSFPLCHQSMISADKG